MAGALHGIRVIEAAQGIAGPYAAMLLAEQGADVVKAEPPAGDRVRGTPGFYVWNRSKRGVIADPASADGRDLLKRLAAASDIFVCDWRPGEVPPGLDYDSLAATNPRLVYLWLPPYGSAGPHAERPPEDALVAALTGVLAGQASSREGPVYLTLPISSYASAALAAAGACAALFVRQRTGLGQRVEVPWIAGALAMMTGFYVYPLSSPVLRISAKERDPQGDLAAYRLYQAGCGGWLFLACGNNDFFNRACIAVGVPEIVSEGRFQNAPWGITDPQAQAALKEIFAAVLRTRPRGEWLRIFAEYDVPVAAVEGREWYMESEIARANEMRVQLNDPTLGPTVQMGVPLALSATPGGVRGPAPLLGQHTAQVLGELAVRAAEEPDPPPAAGSLPAHALEGVRVLDLSSYIAGPLGPQMLADLGADVVKVEPPQGDAFRVLGVGFLGWNRGKRGLAIDLARPDGRDAFLELARTADVVVENYRAGVAERLGVDYASLAAVNPRLIYCSVGGFAREGALAGRPAFDPLLQAQSGAMVAQGDGGAPVFFTAPLSDHMGALLSTFGVAAALFARGRIGRGQSVTTTLARAVMAIQAGEFIFGPLKRSERLLDPEPFGTSPASRAYPTADGWLYVVAGDKGEWRALCRALGLAREAPSYGRAVRMKAGGPWGHRMEGAFRRRRTSTWLRRLDKGSLAGAPRVPCAPVLDPLELPHDRHLWANGLLARHSHPELGEVIQTGTLVHLSATPGIARRPAPLLGEHSRQVLAEAGLASERIEALLRQGAVVQAVPGEGS